MADVTIGALTDATLPLLGTDKMIVSRNGTTLNDTALSNFPVSDAVQTALNAKVDSSTLTESVQDIIGSALAAGSNVTIVYNDAANTITISAAGTNLTATPSPTGIAVNSDTGTDVTLGAADGTNAGLLLPAEKTKLTGIETGAQVNTVVLGNNTFTDNQYLTVGAAVSGGATLTPSVLQGHFIFTPDQAFSLANPSDMPSSGVVTDFEFQIHQGATAYNWSITGTYYVNADLAATPSINVANAKYLVHCKVMAVDKIIYQVTRFA